MTRDSRRHLGHDVAGEVDEHGREGEGGEGQREGRRGHADPPVVQDVRGQQEEPWPGVRWQVAG